MSEPITSSMCMCMYSRGKTEKTFVLDRDCILASKILFNFSLNLYEIFITLFFFCKLLVLFLASTNLSEIDNIKNVVKKYIQEEA